MEKCERCGGNMRMMYPGNDPENGPATMYCKTNADCRAIADEKQAHAEWDERNRIGQELVSRLNLARDTVKSDVLAKLMADASRWIQEAVL